MITNVFRSPSLKSQGRFYVVRATIKAPLPKDSPLRNGTVGYTFSEEYQESLAQASLYSGEATKGIDVLFSREQTFYENILKAEGIPFYDIFGEVPTSKNEIAYLELCRALIAPGGADKYYQEVEQQYKNSPAELEEAKTNLDENIAQKRDLIQKVDEMLKNRGDAVHAAEEIRNMKSTPGLLTPDQMGAEIRAELKQKIAEGYEMDEKLARRIRRM